MPYEIRNNCVYKQGADKPLKCYDNHQDALAYLRALEANVSDAKVTEQDKMFSLPSQTEANYTPAGGTTNHACANCRFFLASWNECHLIDNWPEPILPTGVCDRHEVKRETPLEEMVPMPVVIVEPEFVEIEIESSEMALNVPKAIGGRVKSLFDRLRLKAQQPEPAFKVFKTTDGKMAWVARFSGKWIDRENEIIAEAAHDRYVERVQSGKVAPPELWMWHAKGTRHGQAVAVWKSGGFVLAAGYIDDTAEGRRAFDYYQKNSGKIKLSHMFHYPTETKIDGVYYEYNTIEITTLPDGAEAFPYTSFEEIQTMTLPEQARTMIQDALGDAALERATAADKAAEQDTKTLESQGIASKQTNYDGSPVLDAAKKTQAALDDVQARLKALEGGSEAAVKIGQSVEVLANALKTLTEQQTAQLEATNKMLERLNALEKKQAELTDLQPPGSQSKDTLLDERDKSLIANVMAAAKAEGQRSLVDSLLDGKPVVSSGS